MTGRYFMFEGWVEHKWVKEYLYVLTLPICIGYIVFITLCENLQEDENDPCSYDYIL